MMVTPVFAPDETIHIALSPHPDIDVVCELSRRINMAPVSVGDLPPNSTIDRLGLIPPEELELLPMSSAALSTEKKNHRPFFNYHVVAVNPEQLRQTPKLVLACSGWNKVIALSAAIKLLSPRIIITGGPAAQGLLLSLWGHYNTIIRDSDETGSLAAA